MVFPHSMYTLLRSDILQSQQQHWLNRYQIQQMFNIFVRFYLPEYINIDIDSVNCLWIYHVYRYDKVKFV